jgi:hypothetical protein
MSCIPDEPVQGRAADKGSQNLRYLVRYASNLSYQNAGRGPRYRAEELFPKGDRTPECKGPVPFLK